jgi:phage FluMu gp28-like protein
MPAHAPSTAPAAVPRRSRRAAAGPTPLDTLLPYQRDWVEDAARFKIGCWARQTGKSHATAGEAVSDCLARKTTWVTLSAGERQALEWMRKAHEWATAWKVAVADYTEFRDAAETLLKTAEITWPNGSRLIAIPANPDTARGYSANLTLDEFAFHEQPDAIWRAIFPSISNPLRGEFKIRIVSTPNGLGNKFADLWHKSVGYPQAGPLRKGEWSGHKVDIHTARERGLPVDIEALQAGLDDPEGWAQEFMCEFLDAAAILLPYELIATCESAEATATIGGDYWTQKTAGPRYCGIDFGRKKNLTVCWTLEQVGDVLHTREVLELRDVSTPDQMMLLAPRVAAAARTSFDYTGPGVGLGDLLVERFGRYDPEADLFGRVETFTFTQSSKQELWPKLKMAFEARRVRVPVSRVIREDLHSMQRVTSANGQVTYKAPTLAETDGSHADRATALALAVRAAGTGGGPFRSSRVIRPMRSMGEWVRRQIRGGGRW